MNILQKDKKNEKQSREHYLGKERRKDIFLLYNNRNKEYERRILKNNSTRKYKNAKFINTTNLNYHKYYYTYSINNMSEKKKKNCRMKKNDKEKENIILNKKRNMHEKYKLNVKKNNKNKKYNIKDRNMKEMYLTYDASHSDISDGVSLYNESNDNKFFKMNMDTSMDKNDLIIDDVTKNVLLNNNNDDNNNKNSLYLSNCEHEKDIMEYTTSGQYYDETNNINNKNTNIINNIDNKNKYDNSSSNNLDYCINKYDIIIEDPDMNCEMETMIEKR